MKRFYQIVIVFMFISLVYTNFGNITTFIEYRKQEQLKQFQIEEELCKDFNPCVIKWVSEREDAWMRIYHIYELQTNNGLRIKISYYPKDNHGIIFNNDNFIFIKSGDFYNDKYVMDIPQTMKIYTLNKNKGDVK